MLRTLKHFLNNKNVISRANSGTVNQRVSIQRTITKEEVKLFSEITGDYNPIHLKNNNKPGIVHGALLNGLVSGVIGTKLPGPGTMLIFQEMNFPNPCFVGDRVTVIVELLNSRKITDCKFEIIDSKNNKVLVGSAKLRLT